MRFACSVVVTLLLSSTYAERADACGTWKLEDHELGRTVTFHASTVSTSAKKGVHDYLIRIDDDGTGESVRSAPYGWKKHTPPPPEHTFSKSTLLHRGKPVGELGDGKLTIHGRTYVVTAREVPPDVPPNDGPFGDVAWLVDIKRDGAPVLSGLGRTICADYDPSIDVDTGSDADGEWRGKARVKLTDAMKKEIMLRRIAIYLAVSRSGT